MNKIRTSKIGSALFFLEVPDFDIDWNDKADKTNVLELDQTTPFEPNSNADYQPTTVKYVREEITLEISEQDKVTIASGATYTILETDKTILISYTATDEVILTLPLATLLWDAVNESGKRFLIKDIGCNAFYNNITINANGSDTLIDSLLNQSSTIIDSNGGAVWIQAISTTKFVVY